MDNLVTARTALLAALLRGKSYGAELIDLVADRTKGRVNLNQGSVYPLLRELEREGLLRSWEADPMPERGGRPKRYYELTAEGRRAAHGDAVAMRGLLTLAEAS